MTERRFDETGRLNTEDAEFQYFHATPAHFLALDYLRFETGGDEAALIGDVTEDAKSESRLSEELLAESARHGGAATRPQEYQQVVDGLPTLLEIVVTNETFEPGLYYRGEETGQWRQANIASHYETYVEDFDSIIHGERDEWIRRYRDQRTESVLALTETFLDLVDNGHIDFNGHGWPLATHLASRHLGEVSRDERRDDDAASKRRLKMLAESRLNVDSRTAAHFAETVKKEGILEETAD